MDINTLDLSSHTNFIIVEYEFSSEKLHSSIHDLPDISNNLFVDLHIPTAGT